MEKTYTKEEFTRYTLEVFQPLSARPLTDGDAREIKENMVNLFELLIELEYAKKPRKARKTNEKHPEVATFISTPPRLSALVKANHV